MYLQEYLPNLQDSRIACSKGLLTFARCCDVVLLICVTVDRAFVGLPGDSKI